MSLPHIPILRKGRPYKSIDLARPVHQRTREPFVEISQANSGLIRRDLLDQASMSAPLRARSVRELIAITKAAARHFSEDALSLGDSEQTPDQYIDQVSATTGLPYTLVRRSRDRVKAVLEKVEQVLSGLSRGLDLEVLDRGLGVAGGHALSYIPRADALGIVLPSNAPGVHALWVPAIALKTALVLKPGSAEPWTPYRLIQAFIKAGAPPEAFSYYPADHAGGSEILRRCGRGAVFGDVASTSRWLSDPRIEVHGPGYSKVLLGPDQAERWSAFLDVMTASIADNSGRSCMCASGIWTTAHAPEIADALADRLVKIVPRATEDEQAALAPFADPRVAERISKQIDEMLQAPGARDITAAKRPGPRLVTWNGGTYLLPTIVLVDGPDHPLANREYLFPFAAVVPVRPEEVPERLGPTLALTALTDDEPLVKRLLASPLVNRLNLGPVSTMQIAWDQPHEGNLFEHLYVRRALQRASA